MIKINSIFKNYQIGQNKVSALDNISFSIKKGEFTAIVGASGSGKTTLMNILGCLDTPSGGEYFLDEEDVLRSEPSKLCNIRNMKIGFIFQGFNLIPSLSAFENVELPLIYRKMSKNQRKSLVRKALKEVGLEDRTDHKPSELSGGQQQRVAIARAIAASPPIILADEPCGNLDSKSGSHIMNILHKLNEAGKTIILITHDENAAKTAGRIIRLMDGKIISDIYARQ